MRTAHKLLLVLTSLLLVACRKDPKVFLDDWQLAVAQKDAPAVWALLSTDSRERVVRAIERSQAKAKSDPQFAVVLGNVSRRMTKKNGLTVDPEELAIAYVKHQLELDYGGAGRIGNAKVAGTDVTGDMAEVKATLPAPNGKTIEGKATVRWDQKKWRAVVDVVGLQTQDGDAFAPWILFPYYEGYEVKTEGKPAEGTLTVVREMRLKGGGDPAKLSPEERERAIAEKRLTVVEGAPPLGYEVHVKPGKKSNDDMQEDVIRAAHQITSAQYEPTDIKRGAYQDQLGSVLASYMAVQGTIFPNTAFGNVLDVSFNVDRGGSVATKLSGFNNKTTRNETVELPKLVFAPFPRS